MTEYRKIFPLRLPSGFHGKIKQHHKLSTLYKSKVIERQNPQIGNIKNSTWQLKRLDSDVINQRRQMLVHVGKISSDTPQWFQTTYQFYRRNQAPKHHRPLASEDKRYDVFNRQRVKNTGIFSKTQGTRSQIYDKKFSVTQKIGSRGMTMSEFWGNRERQVSGKVGSLQSRNYNVRKPLLKIGQEGFIDTYSVV